MLPQRETNSNRHGERERLAAEWTRIGGEFTVSPATYWVDLENLVIRSVQVAPEDYRVFFMAATWLGKHERLVDNRRMGKLLISLSGMASAVAGALLSVAREAGGSASLGSLEKHCRPLSSPRALFQANEESPVLRQWTQENSLPLFTKWGLWHSEISLKQGAIRPIGWILKHCPELRIRAILGTGLESAVLQKVWEGARSVSDLSRELHATYASTHEAVQNLHERGLTRDFREGSSRMVSVAPYVQAWLLDFPAKEEQAIRAKTRRQAV